MGLMVGNRSGRLCSSIGGTSPLAFVQACEMDRQAGYSILCSFCLHHVYKSLISAVFKRLLYQYIIVYQLNSC